jgi:hypothetical protein
MVPEIEFEKYADHVASEYLRPFIAKGGSAVKVAVVPDSGTANALRAATVERAKAEGFVTVAIDAAVTQVNLVQQMFFVVASQLDWSGHSRSVVESLLTSLYGEDVCGATTVDAVAEITGADKTLVRMEVNRALADSVLKNYKLAKDFRLAMVQVCLAELQPELYTAESRSVILQWLCGELRLISALKDQLIFHKIARHNARSMFTSTAHWVHQAGMAGLFLVLDVRQFAVPRRSDASEGEVYYTPAALVDAFEVLRQFIDATDEMANLMLLVVAPSELLDEGSKRGFATYQALRNRIWDDVRDRGRVNPSAPMVRIAAAGGPA